MPRLQAQSKTRKGTLGTIFSLLWWFATIFGNNNAANHGVRIGSKIYPKRPPLGYILSCVVVLQY